MFQCLRQVACQKNCEESADELHVFGTHIKLAVLYPFSQYLVTVSPEGGLSRNIILGTKMSGIYNWQEYISLLGIYFLV